VVSRRCCSHEFLPNGQWRGVLWCALSGCGSGTDAIMTHTHNLGFKHGIAWSRMYFTQLKTSDTKYYHVKIKTTTRKHQKCNMFPRLVFSHTSQPPCFPHDPRWAEAALRKGPGWHPLALRRSHLRPWAEVPKDFKWWVCHRYDTLWHIYLYRYLLCICIDIFVWWWILMYFVLFC